MKLLGLKCLAAALALGLLAAATPASAAESKDGDHRRLVVQGEITAIAESDVGRVLTIDRGDADDDPADDVKVRLTADTKVSPPDTAVAVGMEAKAVLLPALPGTLAAIQHLVLKLDDDDRPGGDDKRRELHACGTIATLPADPADGTWTIAVKDVASYDIIVNGETEIEPEGATPAVGDRVCFEAEKTDAGWVAEEIKLKGDDDDKEHRRRVELHGVVKTLPDDMTGTWELVLTLDNGTDVTIQVDEDTEIEGDLAVGLRVAVKAEVQVDDTGTESYLAERIKRLGERGGGKERGPISVRFEGTVTALSDDGGTWTLDDEGTEVVVTVTTETWVRGILIGQDPVGKHAEGVATRQADGSLVAKFLTVSGP